jgi:beta-lactamase regulating signal transducer with metallopeptidase domain
MENSTKHCIRGSERLFMRCILVLSLFAFNIVNALADDGPSLSNLKKNGHAIADEQKNIAHQEFLSYVWMVLGFAVVIAIAWISTVKARNRSKVETEAKQRFIQQNLANRKAHGGLHKARR